MAQITLFINSLVISNLSGFRSLYVPKKNLLVLQRRSSIRFRFDTYVWKVNSVLLNQTEFKVDDILAFKRKFLVRIWKLKKSILLIFVRTYSNSLLAAPKSIRNLDVPFTCNSLFARSFVFKLSITTRLLKLEKIWLVVTRLQNKLKYFDWMVDFLLFLFEIYRRLEMDSFLFPARYTVKTY